MIRWGFLGAGLIARFSLGPAVHTARGAVLHAVAARDIDRARSLHPRVTYSSYEKLLADPEVQVVYVALHNTVHLEWTLRALTAGKHVLCEKPLGLSASQVDQITELATACDRVVIEACWNRWHPRFRDLEKLLASGALGEVQHVDAHLEGMIPQAGNYRLNRDLGGGALYDVGCYGVAGTLGAFQWQEPCLVEATMTYWDDTGADVFTEARLTFPNGGTARVAAGLTGRNIDTLEIHGKEGNFRLDSPSFMAGQDRCTLKVTKAGESEWRHYGAVNPYQSMVEEVSELLEGRPAYIVPLNQSRAVAATLDRVREAAYAPEGVDQEVIARSVRSMPTNSERK
jgi:D-xylose 1-dehydrogenase (NADP+, D-xylono-1,5-lactone-forming)